MKLLSCTILAVFISSLYACKKNSDNPTSDISNPDYLDQSVVYKTIATIPSPADSADGLLKDSITVSRRKNKNDADFLTNISYVNSNISKGFNGFSFGYDDPNNSLPYFLFTANAFPDVPREFQLSKNYEHTSIRATPKPLFLGSHDGFNAMTYFVNNVYPPDAGDPSSRTYTSVSFSKKLKILRNPDSIDTVLFGSGHISGYCIDYYHLTDTTKYVHRWDFTVDFTNLLIDY